ncbi:EmrA Multidrug resistance efflux pump [Oxalobacteraceae bacterium]
MHLKELPNIAKRYFGRLLILFTIVALVTAFGSRVVLGPKIPAALVVQRDFIQTIVATGHVETPHRISVGSQIVGVVKNIPVSEGQIVQAGQVLIELDDAEWRAAAQQADMLVLQAQARLRQVHEVQAPVAAQSLVQAEINVSYAEKQWHRNVDLFTKSFISQAALDEAKKNVDLTQAQLQTAKKQVQTTHPTGSDYQIAATALSQAEANSKVAYSRRQHTIIKTPIAGTLISRDVETGDVVQAGKALMTLSPSGATQLVIQIDEKNLPLLVLGQLARASADAYPTLNFSAAISYINPSVDLQRGSVEIKLNVPEPPAYLRQDMTVSVDIQVATRLRALLVPTDTIHDVKGRQPWVLKVADGKARKQVLRVGLQSAGMGEVLSGLSVNDRVLTFTNEVNEGDRIRPISYNEAP